MNTEIRVALPANPVKYVMWRWMSNAPYLYVGVLANTYRPKAKAGNWVIIQEIKTGKLYEVLDIDLTEVE